MILNKQVIFANPINKTCDGCGTVFTTFEKYDDLCNDCFIEEMDKQDRDWMPGDYNE